MLVQPRHRYDLLAIDLDGTLIGPDGRVADADVEAIRAARRAGIRVTVCTGRGLIESSEALDRIDQLEPVIVAGGAIRACPVHRRTLHRFPMTPVLTRDAVVRLLDAGHAALVFKDGLEIGYDYLVVTGDGLRPDPVTLWWFERMGVQARYAPSLDDDEHPDHTVRVGACAEASVMNGVADRLVTSLGDRFASHCFPAVVGPAHIGGTYHIMELFDPRANKWTALSAMAGELGIASERICAIGDQVNDLPMLANAGLGIAMGNGVPEAIDAADRVTRAQAEHGVAHAVDRILAGEW